MKVLQYTRQVVSFSFLPTSLLDHVVNCGKQCCNDPIEGIATKLDLFFVAL